MAIAGFDSPAPYAQMVCLGRYIRRDDHSAVMGLVVKENDQGVGIGSFLAKCLMKAAQWHKVSKLIAHVGVNNKAMIKIYEKWKFKKELKSDEKKYIFSLDVVSEEPGNMPDPMRGFIGEPDDQ